MGYTLSGKVLAVNGIKDREREKELSLCPTMPPTGSEPHLPFWELPAYPSAHQGKDLGRGSGKVGRWSKKAPPRLSQSSASRHHVPSAWLSQFIGS